MSRIPFVAAVVGALLVGGATTGGTRASWVASAPLSSSTVNSGSLNFTPSPLSDSLTLTAGGPAGERIITVNDSSAGKNLVRSISASISSNAALTSNLFMVNASNACTSTPFTSFSGSLGGEFKVCLRITATAVPTPNPAALTLSLNGQQTRSGPGLKWSRMKTVPITVLVNSGKILNCGTQTSKNEMPITWSNPPGVTKAEVQSSASETGTYTTMTGGTSTPAATSFTITQTTVGNLFYRVKFTGGSVPTSNVLRITRDNNSGNSNLSYCGAP